MPKNYRTLNPWGHVSKADLLYRQRLQRIIYAHGQITQKVEKGAELFDELKNIHIKAQKDINSLSQDEKNRFNEICDLFVSKGISEDIIEQALGE